MKSLSKLQITLIVFSVFLLVLLYFGNKTPELDGENLKLEKNQVSSVDFKTILDKKLSFFSDSIKKEVEKLHKLEKDNSNKSWIYDSLVVFFDKSQSPDFAAFYSEKKAHHDKTEKNWLIAGERYYFAIRFVKDEQEVKLLYDRAIYCLNKVSELNPSNTSAKIKLASCIVEGTEDPMKGISLLREIEKTDSNNIELQLAFAAFSVKSGQLDKAISRFEKVIRLKKDYIEAYLYLADAYEKIGEKSKAIDALEKYASYVKDEGVKKEIKTYIDQLK